MNSPLPSAIEVARLSKCFGVDDVLFEDFSLDIPQGQSVAIVGPNGAGKSTLLNLISLLDIPTTGKVSIQGTPRTSSDVGKFPLAYIFQRDALMPWSTVLENTLLGLKCKGKVTSTMRDDAARLLREFGLGNYLDRYPGQLSGGQRQMVALAQNLLLAPRLLLLDEPFSGLDYQNKLLFEQRLLDVLNTPKNRDMTTLLVTHDLRQALQLADRILVIGRRPGQPSAVALDLLVPFPRAERDLDYRNSAGTQVLFTRLWETLKPFVQEAANAS